jgi:hypothetical protein
MQVILPNSPPGGLSFWICTVNQNICRRCKDVCCVEIWKLQQQLLQKCWVYIEAYKLGVCQQKFSHTYLHISCFENNKSLMCLRTTGEIAFASKCDISQYSVASNTFKTWQQFLSFSPSVFMFCPYIQRPRFC